MIAEIIAIGTEVATGSINNTNTRYLSQELINLGVDVYYHTVVDDNVDRIKNIIDIALNRADVIITIGGLGPTKDDLTKEVICDHLNLELIKDEGIYEDIKNKIRKNNKVLTNNNEKQAYKPEVATFLKNENGTAPGLFIPYNDRKIILLPGPPSELKSIFNNHVKELLKPENNIQVISINTIGLGESVIESKLREMNIDLDHTQVLTFASQGKVEIRLISEAFDKDIIKKETEYIIDKINSELKDYIYSYGNISISECVINLLKEKNMKVGFCESCTGGLLSSMITEVSGSSAVFDRGIVTYSNEAKIQELNVSEDTLNKYGAVSEQTAYEMAKGLLDKAKLDMTVSITGIAGPNSDDTNKPVGLVYICVMTDKKYEVVECNFYGDRHSIQRKSAMKALELVRNNLIH